LRFEVSSLKFEVTRKLRTSNLKLQTSNNKPETVKMKTAAKVRGGKLVVGNYGRVTLSFGENW
jgi:hypothetical protein